jgi:hypothetical protein
VYDVCVCGVSEKGEKNRVEIGVEVERDILLAR